LDEILLCIKNKNIMRHTVGNLLQTEYINAADLIGIDDEEANEELSAELGKMNPIKRQEHVKKLITTKIPSQGSRLEFEKHFIELPQHIKISYCKIN
jgi:hypothetical protein